MSTPFQQSVWQQLTKIPKGKVVTYAEIARSLACRSSRAIGQAVKRNPFAPQVPCHRVIRSDLTLGGYQGAVSGDLFAKKLQLLEEEGVYFDESGRLQQPDNLFQFT